ncbi:CLUMA_CG009693, isoform A, partial [Clunio marinus]
MICSRFKSIATLALIFLTLFITPLYVECGSKKSSSSAASAHEPTIEEVNAKQLERILSEKEYVAVYWYARSCVTCDTVLEELEKIDDDTDAFGVDFVKINDKRLAKQYGIHKFPALTYYREKQPIIYEGDLMDEEGVLDFLTSLEAMDLPDRIEEVNGKILAKIIEDTDYLAVLFCPDHGNCGHGLLNKPECRKCAKALQELENIDDEADQLGIGFVKIHDETLADEYNLGELPRLVYYRHKTPIIYENELSREEDVLEWLIENKSTGDDEDVIEEVSAKNLGTLIQNIDNLVVVFYGKDDDDSLQVIEELEKIDDDCDKHGIQFVKIDDKGAAKEHGVKELPTIIFFEKQEPTRYEGDLMDEDELLHWLLSHLENDEIEDIDEDELDRMVKEGRTMAVLFYDNNDKKSGKVLAELENIDDECDQLGIAFVKIDDAEEAKEYGIDKMPKLLYFEKGIPTVYEGNLEKEEEVLKWIEMQSSSDEIEDVTDEMLDIIISKMHHVAVLFYDKDSKKSQKVLAELENIDDECDQNDIAFVKIDDDNEAHEWGIDELPTMVLFERGIPHIYEGDLMQEDELLGWLIYQKKHSEIPEVTDEMKDKLIETFPHVAVIFYDKDDKQDIRVLNEMENIDDDLEREGIIIVRIDNADEAKEYGLNHLPAMVYFEDKIPAIYEGDLMNEDEVLEWLIIQKNTATIEEVTDEILDDLIEDHEYVVVYFTGDCEEGEKCDKILDDLENIDDELDEAGIIFVTTEELDIAKKYGIKSLPKLVFFRNKDPLIYSGDLDDEDEVLAWLTDENTLEIPGKIEEVNMKMLEKILSENDHIVVFFYPEGDKKSQKILNELENIDDECEEKDIDFVKTSDDGIATEYDLPTLPALAFYRHKFRTIYTGDLMNEDEILKWVLELIEATPDVIESVDRRTLQVLINDIEHLAVFFYSDKCETCPAILDRLETIDDDTDKHDIQFVKTDDVKLAHDIGVFSFPALIYYETGVPIMFDGNLKSEKKILQWLVDQKNDECFYVGIERGNDNAKKSEKSYVVPYQCCPSTKEKAQARLAVLSDTKLGTSKAIRNDITFTFEHDEEDKPAAKPKGGKKLKAPSKPAQEDRKSKKEDNKKDSAQEKKKRERDVKEKESRDTKDKDFDKKDKKGKDKKDKGKHTNDDDGDGFFQLGNW